MAKSLVQSFHFFQVAKKLTNFSKILVIISLKKFTLKLILSHEVYEGDILSSNEEFA